MPDKRLSVRKINEGIVPQNINLADAATMNCFIAAAWSANTSNARNTESCWPLPVQTREYSLEQLLFPPPSPQGGVPGMPD